MLATCRQLHSAALLSVKWQMYLCGSRLPLAFDRHQLLASQTPPWLHQGQIVASPMSTRNVILLQGCLLLMMWYIVREVGGIGFELHGSDSPIGVLVQVPVRGVMVFRL
mmetsp:Transcript_39532/g.112104  ORF Transcript_39532/g.112104 Transcript_39532/m.112104 type:complete len:109 (-) Transcript_39532:232-558(-)